MSHRPPRRGRGGGRPRREKRLFSSSGRAAAGDSPRAAGVRGGFAFARAVQATLGAFPIYAAPGNW
jgi:hypothetical protein